MKKVVVYCGSSKGNDPIYELQGKNLAACLADQGIELVYGGGCVGIMGVIADAVLDLGGQVTGVIPQFLIDAEVAHQGLSHLIVVETLHQRKKIMEELADGVIVLPGGYGTLDEFFEMLTWAQLGLHHKPLGLFNVNGYYDPLLQQIDIMVREGFLKPANKELIRISSEISTLLADMRSHQPGQVKKWINPS